MSFRIHKLIRLQKREEDGILGHGYWLADLCYEDQTAKQSRSYCDREPLKHDCLLRIVYYTRLLWPVAMVTGKCSYRVGLYALAVE